MTPRPASSTRPRRRRLLLRILLGALFVTPVLVFLLSNAWLHTSWGTNWLAQQISHRVGIPVQIGSAGWLPGGQVWINDFRVLDPTASKEESPSPMLQIRCVSIRPAWSAWLRGSRKISDVHLTSPRLYVSLETLQNFLPTPSAPPPVAEPAVAANSPTPPPAATPAPTPDATPAPTFTEPPSPTVWLKITDGHLSVTHSAQVHPLLEIKDISAILPIAGAPATGHLHSGSIHTLNQTLAPDGHIDIGWQYPLWESTSTALQVSNLKAKAKFQVARAAGLPFSLIIAQEPQSLRYEAANFEVDQFQSLHRLAGFFLAPQTWQGESLGQAQKIKASLGSQQVGFFAAQSRIILLGGTLQCSDFRLLGDDFSLLGNGMLNSRGECLGIIRLTAPRAAALEWENRWRNAYPEQPLTMQPLWNEDRRAIDFLCGGSPAQQWLSFDQGKTLLDLAQITHRWRITPDSPPLSPNP